MPKGNHHKQASEPFRRASRAGASPAKEFVPPLTTTLKTFVKNGSDHELRELIFELNSLFNQMKRHADYFARYIGVSPAQLTFMLIIAEMSNVTVRQIAEQMNVTSPFVTAEIGKLVDMDIVCKEQNSSDRRSSFLKLTSRGENLVRELAPILCRANDLHFRSLTEERARVLKETIHAIVVDGRRVIHELESPDLRNATAPSVGTESATRGKSIERRKSYT